MSGENKHEPKLDIFTKMKSCIKNVHNTNNITRTGKRKADFIELSDYKESNGGVVKIAKFNE